LQDGDRDGVVAPDKLVEAADPEQRFALAAGVAECPVQFCRALEERQLRGILAGQLGVFLAKLQEPAMNDPAPGQRQIGLHSVEFPVRRCQRAGIPLEQRTLIEQPGPFDAFVHAAKRYRSGRNDRREAAVAACMTTVGLIGSGMIGGTVARLSVAAGHQVVLSNSRGPETLEELARELGPLVRAGTGAQAAAGDIVVVAIPLRADPSVPAGPLAGKTVIDANNYYPQRDGQIAELDSGAVTSSGLLQRHLSGSHVVKAFNNIFYRHLLSLARLAGVERDVTFLPIAGDDPAAKQAVTAFLDSIGYGTVDAGSLADSWRQEPGTPVYGAPYGPFSLEKGTPASEDTIRAALAAATR
jgi:predicted dinucleotide-binding enzyme